MKTCPCCGAGLVKGSILSPHRIRWTTTDRDFGGFLNEADGEFLLKRGKSFWKGLYDGFPYPGYYCPACDLILLPQKEDDEL